MTLPPGELIYRWMSALGSSDLQEQQLGDDRIRHFVVDRRAEENDPVLQQATVNIHRPLFAAAFFDDERNQWHGSTRWMFGVRIARISLAGNPKIVRCFCSYSSSSSSACTGGLVRMSSTRPYSLA